MAALTEEFRRERDAWIAARGSTRLKKGLALGYADTMTTVYLEERIADFHPRAMLVKVGYLFDLWSDVHNPLEADLDVLAEIEPWARARIPGVDVRLGMVSWKTTDARWLAAVKIAPIPFAPQHVAIIPVREWRAVQPTEQGRA